MPTQAPSPRYVAALLIAAMLVLVLGSFLKPEPVATEAAPAPPPQSEVRRLYRMSLRTSVDNMTEYFALVAGDIDPVVVRLAQMDASGIVWDSRTVVGAAAGTIPPEATLVETASGEGLGAIAVAAGPDLPLVGMQLTSVEDLTPAAHSDGQSLKAGQWLLAAWRDQAAARHTPGNLVGSTLTTCSGHSLEEIETSISLSRMMMGGGIFDLDGRLVAIILECDGRPIAVSTGSVSGLLYGAMTTDGRLWDNLGLKAGPLAPAQAEYLRTDSGLFITETWRGYPADRAGLRPGDVILKLSEQPVQTSEDLAPLLQPISKPLKLVVKRGPKTLTIAVSLAAAEVLAGTREDGSGLAMVRDTAGFPIESVRPGSREAAAGIRPGDRLLRVDFTAPRDLRQLRRLLSNDRGGALFIEILRGHRSFGLLVE